MKREVTLGVLVMGGALVMACSGGQDAEPMAEAPTEAPAEAPPENVVEVERIEGVRALSALAKRMRESEGFSLVEIREAETAVAFAVGLAPDRAAFVPLVGLRAGLPLAQVAEVLAPALSGERAPGWWTCPAAW